MLWTIRTNISNKMFVNCRILFKKKLAIHCQKIEIKKDTFKLDCN
jgi:hypothetical protein